jgi:hypothetical protein
MAPFHVDQSKCNAISIQSKDKIGAWDVADIEAFKPERWLVRMRRARLDSTIELGPRILLELVLGAASVSICDINTIMHHVLPF